MTVATTELYREITYLAYHLHWSLGEILDLEHPLRRRFVQGVDELRQRQAGSR